MPNLTAKLTLNDVRNGHNMAPQKETVKETAVVAHHRGELRLAIQAVWYRSRTADGASPTYCSVWIRGPRSVSGSTSINISGHGKASGYGYDKESAALAEALRSAGVHIKRDGKPYDIGGTGYMAERDALTAVARALGYRKTIII